MNRWPRAPLGEICEINPRVSAARQPSASTDVSFVPMAAVDETDGKIVEPQVRKFEDVAKGYTAFQDNDVLFAKITPCMENGKAAIANRLVNGLGFGSTEFFVVRSGDRILPEYVFYVIRQPEFRRLAKANFTGTAGQQRVPKQYLERFPIPLPPLPEQRRIVDILNRAAGIRRLRREVREKARQLIPALFVDMFGDPATNSKGWPVRKLSEVSEIRSGVTKGRKMDGGDAEEIPYLRVANVQDGHLNLNEIKTIPVIPTDVSHDSFAHSLVVMEATRLGVLMRSFQASQQAWTMAS